MDKITSLQNLVVNSEYVLDGSIAEIINEGDASAKRPISLKIIIENGKGIFKLSTWEYKMLPIFKEVLESHEICEITIKPTEYREEISYRLTSLTQTGKYSEKYSRPVVSEGNSVEIERINELIGMVNNPQYKALIDELILKNPNFFTWKAAHAMHHAFVGGLVYHSLSVCDQALTLANYYNGKRNIEIDYDVLITGALLHDIGKLLEYNSDGTYSFMSSFMSHLTIGVDMINDACIKLGFDKSSLEMLKLKHIILSHHGKKEWGSPVVPAFIEARIIHEADNTDAHMEEVLEGLEFVEPGKAGNVRGLDGSAIITMYKF